VQGSSDDVTGIVVQLGESWPKAVFGLLADAL
jgi:hypothetical protein